MLAQLLPEEFVVRECEIANAIGPLHPEEARWVEKAVPKRKQEFLAGRSCAREALSLLGVKPAMLPCNSDRTPAWPVGVIGSITHSTHHCAVAIALASQVASVGIDIEEVSRFDEKLLPLICTPRELDGVQALTKSEQEAIGTILFSAKESVYKCQYMLTRQWLTFHDVEVELDRGLGEFHAKLPARLFGQVGIYIGKYSCQKDLVATAIVIRNQQ